MMTRSEAARWLLSHDHFCILSHRRPDGDTLGAGSALCLGLRALGKEASVLYNPEASEFLSRCQEGLTVEKIPEEATLVSVDVATVSLLPQEVQPFADRIALRIDHHGNTKTFTPLELVDPSASSAADIVWDLLTEMGVALDKAMAWRLYIALSTDTGCFRYANTNAHTYQTAAACAATGADLYPITQELFDTNSMAKLRLQSWIVEHAVFLCGGMAAVCAIPGEIENTVTKDDLDGISGFLRSIEGVRISATIRENEGGSKMSIRAVPGYDASAVCAAFGGGGHRGAAGATLSCTPAEAVPMVADALRMYVEGK